jgi:hypothetical protein
MSRILKVWFDLQITLHAIGEYSSPRTPQRPLSHANIAVLHAAGEACRPAIRNTRPATRNTRARLISQGLQPYNAVLVRSSPYFERTDRAVRKEVRTRNFKDPKLAEAT